MRKNRLLAVVCAMVMNASTPVGSIPVFAEETAEPNVQTDMKITGTSPLGEMLADKLTPEQTALNEQNGCSIYEVELSDKQAYVQFDTALDCTLLLTFFDDAEETLLSSAKAEVTMEQTDIILDVPDMPEYCYLHCCLIDTETLAPVSAEYTSALYTKEMQEFLSKTTEDFDEELVLNLDEDKSKNFMVLEENAVYLQSNDNVNTAEFDEKNSLVTLTNCDNDACNVKIGDIVCLDCDESSKIFRAVNVQIGEERIEISMEEVQFADLFSYINIKLDSSNVLTKADEMPTQSRPKQYLPGAMNAPSDNDNAVKKGPFPFGGNDKDYSGNVLFTLTPTAQYYQAGDVIYADADLQVDAALTDLVLKVKGEEKIPLLTLELDLGMEFNGKNLSGSNVASVSAGSKKDGFFSQVKKFMGDVSKLNTSASVLSISYSANLMLNGTCTVSGNCTIGSKLGVAAGSDGTVSFRKSNPALKKSDFTLDGEFFIGLSSDVELDIFKMPVLNGLNWEHKSVFVVSRTDQFGFQFTASPNQHYAGGKWQPVDAHHLCNCCCEGEIYWDNTTKASITSDFELLNALLQSDGSLSNEKPNCHIKLADWHYSKDYNEFALTPCPHHYHKITIQYRYFSRNRYARLVL